MLTCSSCHFAVTGFMLMLWPFVFDAGMEVKGAVDRMMYNKA